ncbi:MAG: putative endoglucanase, partial [Clostridia bacterium]|nr:putative endoglucanase [Clostridia bacterium]
MKQLKVTENRRYLEYADGTPFFYLGDTAWELFHRITKAETEYYLSVRASQGFNAIQAVCLAEFDGIRIPNAYGRYPLKKNSSGEYDPTLPDTDGPYSYWEHVDYVVETAE